MPSAVQTLSAGLRGLAPAAPFPLPVPNYLQKAYWWAYVHPNAVRVFEREWLINLILFGNYGRLRDVALEALGKRIEGRTLQVACAYGSLTPGLHARLAEDARLDVIDVLPVQLQNLARKLPSDERVTLMQRDSTRLGLPDASYDQVLVFFLLHEQPEAERRATLGEALRVCKPGGRIVLVDYARPSPRHPLLPLMKLVFRYLEPFASGLWVHDLLDFVPEGEKPDRLARSTYFGGLYQMQIWQRTARPGNGNLPC